MIALYGLEFILLFVFFYLVIYKLSSVSIIEKFNSFIIEGEKRRAVLQENLRRMEGNQDKTGIFYRIDMLINKSGLKRRVGFLTTELLCVSFLMIFFCFFLIGLFTNKLFLGVLFGIVIVFGFTIIIKILADINHVKIENQIIHFLNMVENYSRTYDDLITIFGKVYPFLKEPLKSGVMECYGESMNTGDISTSFRKLEVKIGHEKFSEILRNLELCGRYDANYQSIISSSREIMTNYVKSRRKIKSLVKDARLDFLILIACMVVIFFVLNSFMGENLIGILLSGKLGIIILIYLLFVIAYGFFSVFSIK